MKKVFYSDHQCTLAMRRLSIIGLKNGKQPIYNETKASLVFFNGEIYNYGELKKDLEKKGHVFITTSDTEVLIHLYEEYNENMLSYLNGMFAFCIYDIEKQKYLFARDRFGEKPFFYNYANGKFSFSSELKSLIQDHSIKRILNKEALNYYLRLGIIPEGLTMFDGIMSLSPGHFITLNFEGVVEKKYYNLLKEQPNKINSLSEAKEIIKPKIQEAVKRQMVSEVPIGAFLSGGIDSSTIVAFMQQQSSKPVKTFTVKFEEASFDESSIARDVASKLGTDHHEITIPNSDFKEDIFWKIIDHVGQPFSDTSAIPTFEICKEIKQHITVALSGDGGDELFAGYDVFKWYQQICLLRKAPKFSRKIVSQVISGMQKGKLDISILRQMNKALDFSYLSQEKIPVHIHQMFNTLDIGQMTGRDDLDFSKLYNYYPEVRNYSDLRKMMSYRLLFDLPSDMLIKVDSMAMANSLEVRVPFLDVDLFESSKRLSNKLLINGKDTKYLIREIMKNDLPESVFNHPKQGFAIPLHKYMNKNFIDLARSLFEDNSEINRFLNKEILDMVLKNGLEQTKDNSNLSVYRATQRLWSLMQLFGWMKRFNVSVD